MVRSTSRTLDKKRYAQELGTSSTGNQVMAPRSPRSLRARVGGKVLMSMAGMACGLALLAMKQQPMVEDGTGRGLLQELGEAPVIPVPADECSRTIVPVVNGTLRTKGVRLCEDTAHWQYPVNAVIVLYMFWALGVVVDENFVSIIEFIVEELALSEEVAGATFMAAGGSAPEFFTNMVSTFGLTSTGFGTVVGSAVFNVLFVIAMSALFARPRAEVLRRRERPSNAPWPWEPLPLTWWPLFRDCVFYVVAVSTLAVFFFFWTPYSNSRAIIWYESLALFLLYVLYCVQMAFQPQIQAAVARLLPCLVPADQRELKLEMPAALISALAAVEEDKDKDAGAAVAVGDAEQPKSAAEKRLSSVQQLQAKRASFNRRGSFAASALLEAEAADMGPSDEDMDDVDAPRLRPSSWRGDPAKAGNVAYRAAILLAWILYLPILFAQTTVWFDKDSLAAIKSKVLRRTTATLCFLICLVWIAAFTFLMVYAAESLAVTVGLPEVVLGYTVLAIGTSIPDLLSSVFVAQYGFGDMAVSSSIGSNIFDVLVGLPLPWLLRYAITGDAQPVTTNSIGLSLSIIVGMVICLVAIIIWQGWKLTKVSAYAMLTLYFGFLAAVCIPELI